MNSCYFKIQKKTLDNINMDHKKTLMNVAQDLVPKQDVMLVAMKMCVPQTGDQLLEHLECPVKCVGMKIRHRLVFQTIRFFWIFLQELATSLLLKISTL